MKITRTHSLVSFLILFLLSFSFVIAQAPPIPPGGQPPGGGGSGPGGGGGSSAPCIPSSNVICLDNPFKTGGNLIDFIKMIINEIVLPLGGVLAVLAFIYTGFKYVLAQGDSAKIQEAHRAFLYTVIGTGILLGAWLITDVLTNTIDKLKTG